MSRKARNSLVMDNFRLRKANIELAAGEQKFTFQAVLGEAPHQAVFSKLSKAFL